MDKMRDIVADGILSEKTIKSVMQDIRNTYGVSKNKVQFRSRDDHMANLNSDITEAQQEDAVVDEYIWSSSKDGRVRDRHRQKASQRALQQGLANTQVISQIRSTGLYRSLIKNKLH